MKKEIHKIWGVGLAVILAASLLLSAAPVSGGTLGWDTETIPSTTGNVLANGTDIADLAVADDGTMYLVTGLNVYCYKSTNDGATWSKLTKAFPQNADFVAVAPDDSDIVVVAENIGYTVWISTDGGSTFGQLTDISSISNIRDLAVSSTDGVKNYIGVAGEISPDAEVWYWPAGASAPSWTATSGNGLWPGSQTAAWAVEFSPNVASDKVMVAVTGNSARINYQMYGLSTDAWNTPFDPSYPVHVYDGTNVITGVDSATVGLAPDYLGSDDAMRIAFVGVETGDNAQAGIYRLKDTSVKEIYDGLGKDVYSVDFDGTNLVAGNAVNTKVYHSDNPLATSPDFSTVSTLKRPGLSTNTKTIVAWKGSDVVAGTTGDHSAFAISKDNGKSFNDISFVDTYGANMGTMLDVAVSSDGSKTYMLVNDTHGLSLWRSASSWERVIIIAGNANYIVRVAPDDANAVYLAERTSTTMYFSQEGGDTKWFNRTSKYNIQDLATESADVAYIAEYGSNTVSETTNSGFTWGTAESTGLAGNVHMIRSLGKDKVIVGGTTGYVAYSTDGNDSWTKINKVLDGATNIQVTASGLGDGDLIYASGSTAAKKVERWEIGQSGTTWKNLEAPTTGNSTYGIGLADGVLYVGVDDGTDSWTLRTLSPDTSEPASGMWSTSQSALERFTATPQALKVSAGSTKLWSVDKGAAVLFSFTDTLTETGPSLVSPRDGADIQTNPISGITYTVAFSWDRPSKGKIYDLQIALDSGFVEKVYTTTTASITDATISEVVAGSNFMPDTRYYWRVRVNIAGPVRSPWSETRSFTISELPEALPTVVIEQPPAPVISVPPPPAITITPPQIVLPAPPPAPPEIVIPPAPVPEPPIPSWTLIVIIIIGAVLVLALIVLILRTRRPV